MDSTFDEAYARYLAALKQLDQTEEITEKNTLFRQLTKQLSDLEQRLDSDFAKPAAPRDIMSWDVALRDQQPGRLPTKNP